MTNTEYCLSMIKNAATVTACQGRAAEELAGAASSHVVSRYRVDKGAAHAGMLSFQLCSSINVIAGAAQPSSAQSPAPVYQMNDWTFLVIQSQGDLNTNE